MEIPSHLPATCVWSLSSWTSFS